MRVPSSTLVLCLALTSAGVAPAFAAATGPASAPRETASTSNTSSVELLESAEDSYGKLSYEDANRSAKAAIKTGGLGHDQLVRAYRVLATTHGVLDHESEATEAFVQLLGCDPSYTVDSDLGPRISVPFSGARTYWRAQGYQPSLTAKVQTGQNRHGTMQLVVRLPSRVVKRVVVGQRWSGSGDFTLQPVTALESTFDILAAPANATRYDYYVQALDAANNVVLEAGSASLPRTVLFDLPGGSGGSGGGGFWSSPWVYVGGAVLLGGAATAFAFSQPQTPTKANFSPLLLCGDAACKAR